MSEQDQLISVFARPSPYEREDEEDRDATPIPLPRPRRLRASLADAQRPAEYAFATMALHRATTPAQRDAIVFGQGVAVVVRVRTRWSAKWATTSSTETRATMCFTGTRG